MSHNKIESPNNTTHIVKMTYTHPENGSEFKLFDVREHDGRQAMVKFITWCVNARVDCHMRVVDATKL